MSIANGRSLILALTLAALGWTGAALGEESSGGTPGAPPLADVPSDPPIRTVPVARFAPTGQAQQLLKITLPLPDCSSAGTPTWRIVEAAGHGEISVEAGNQFPEFAPTSNNARCNDSKMPGVRVLYKSTDDYKGVDAAKILFIYPDGSATQFAFTIKVL